MTINEAVNLANLVDAVAADLGRPLFTMRSEASAEPWALAGIGALAEMCNEGHVHVYCCADDDGFEAARAAATNWSGSCVDAGTTPPVGSVQRCDGCGRPVLAVGADVAEAVVLLLDVTVPDGVS